MPGTRERKEERKVFVGRRTVTARGNRSCRLTFIELCLLAALGSANRSLTALAEVLNEAVDLDPGDAVALHRKGSWGSEGSSEVDVRFADVLAAGLVAASRGSHVSMRTNSAREGARRTFETRSGCCRTARARKQASPCATLCLCTPRKGYT